MFDWIKKRNNTVNLVEKARIYLHANYQAPASQKKKPIHDDEIKYSRILDAETTVPSGTGKEQSNESQVMHSLRSAPAQNKEKEQQDSGVKFSLRDNYNSSTIRSAMRSLSDANSPQKTLKTLDEYTDVSFVDAMLEYINDRRLRDADVYKAAQIDRRLFSKIVSDSSYKPAKDTCVALCLALHLTLKEANDLLSRAGYTFSHSSKRDVILEFFFREQIYDINDVNEILFRLDQKILGR